MLLFCLGAWRRLRNLQSISTTTLQDFGVQKLSAFYDPVDIVPGALNFEIYSRN